MPETSRIIPFDCPCPLSDRSLAAFSPCSPAQNTSEFAADVRLVFSNARLFNSDPSSDVHVAAKELYEQFEAKFAALGPGLDDPPLKRKKSSSGGSCHAGTGVRENSGPSVESDVGRERDRERPEVERDRKRKSSGGGGGGTGAGGVGAGGSSGASGSKKARPTSEEDFNEEMTPAPTVMMLQKRILEMEATIQRMERQQSQQGAGLGAQEVHASVRNASSMCRSFASSWILGRGVEVVRKC